MPLVLILGLIFPRFVIFVLWFFDWFVAVPVDWIVGLLGFIFMPFTLLWFSVVWHFYSGTFGFWQMLILGIAVLVDLSHLFASGREYYVD